MGSSLKTRAFCAALAAIGLLGALTGARAATINVTTLQDSGPGSLRQAIQDAAAGDLVFINLTGTLNFASGALVVGKDLSIEGPGARTRPSLAADRRSRGLSFGTNPKVT
jgi:hypothetical protein